MHVGDAGGGGQGAGLRRGGSRTRLAAAPRLVMRNRAGPVLAALAGIGGIAPAMVIRSKE
jgi:hypothetical protein